MTRQFPPENDVARLVTRLANTGRWGPDDHNPVRHVMRFNAYQAKAAGDEITIAPHGFAVTHLDALGHVFCGDEAYNGRRADPVCTIEGLTHGDFMDMRDGIVTHGVPG